MISPLTGTKSTKQTSKQSIAKDIDIENRLTVIRGEIEGIMGEKGEGFIGTIIKDIWKATRGDWKQGKEVGRAGVVERGGGERQKTT